MSKRLFLCEKPDQGRMISANLGAHTKAHGYIEGDDWIVTWCFGHLLTPNMPEDYDPDLKDWKWETLPIIPKTFILKPKDGMASKQISVIAAQMKRAHDLVIATDADREGELIAYEVINRLKWTGPMKRLWLSDLTSEAVRHALANLKPSEETRPLYWAAAARTYADWIVGMNLSRAATMKMRAETFGSKPLSVGRVQTPVLALIVDNERRITNFKPEAYFEIVATMTSPSGTVAMRHAPDEKNRIKTRQDAEAVRARALDQSAPIKVTSDIKQEGPPALHDLLALQQDANSIFGWSADKTLGVAQSLYEKQQALTYPRTDCRCLPEAHKPNIARIRANLESVPGVDGIAKAMTSPEIRKSTYDDKKVTAHHAIVPTMKAPELLSMSEDERALYMVVVRRWLANHMPDHVFLETKMIAEPGGVQFRTGGRVTRKPGWKEVYTGAPTDEDENADIADGAQTRSLPPIKDGEIGRANPVVIEDKMTKPPARFTEKTLLGAMKDISRFVDDADAKKILKNTDGIGTPATRSNIIETLKVRDYIKIRKKQIHPSEIGMGLIDGIRKVAPNYANPVMTAEWEKILDLIASGQEPKLNGVFVKGIADRVREDVAHIQGADIDRIRAKDGATGAAGKGAKAGAGHGGAGFIAGDWKEAIRLGKAITVPFDKKDEAKALGARFDGDRKSWVIPKGLDEAAFQKAGFTPAPG